MLVQNRRASLITSDQDTIILAKTGAEQMETVNTDEIFRILGLLEESQWNAIELTTSNLEFKAYKRLPHDCIPSSAYTLKPPPTEREHPRSVKDTQPHIEVEHENKSESESRDTSKIETEIKGPAIYAPMIGTFYRSPSPGAPPFVAVGDIIAEDTIVCVIEVMKVMSSIRAEQRGRISSILAEDGKLVQYNQPLFLIEAEG